MRKRSIDAGRFKARSQGHADRSEHIGDDITVGFAEAQDGSR